MRTLFKKVRSIDFLSSKAEIYGNGSSVILQSIFGGIVSLITLSFILLTSGYFSLQFFSYEKPLVIQNSEYRNNSEIADFPSFPFLFRISDQYGYSLPEESRLFSVRLVWCKSIHDENDKVVQEYEFINVSLCNSTQISNLPSVITEQINDLNSYYCTAWPSTNYSLKGLYGGSDNYTFTYYEISQCQNGVKGQNCQTVDFINSQLSTAYLDTIFFDNQVTPTNKDPNKLIISTKRYVISNTFFRRLWIYLSQTDIITDEGLILENLQTINFFQIENTEMTISSFSEADIMLGNAFMAITISNHKYKNFYFRSYLKIQDALSNIGGIIEVIFMLGMLACRIFGWNLADLECSEGYPFYYAYDLDTSSDINLFGSKNKIFNKMTIIKEEPLKDKEKHDNYIKENSKSFSQSRIQNQQNAFHASFKESHLNNFQTLRCSSPIEKSRNSISPIYKECTLDIIQSRVQKMNLQFNSWERIIPFKFHYKAGSRNIFRLQGRVFEKQRALNYKNLMFKLSEIDYIKDYIFTAEQHEVYRFLHCDLAGSQLNNGSLRTHPFIFENLRNSLNSISEKQFLTKIDSALLDNYMKVQIFK